MSRHVHVKTEYANVAERNIKVDRRSSGSAGQAIDDAAGRVEGGFDEAANALEQRADQFADSKMQLLHSHHCSFPKSFLTYVTNDNQKAAEKALTSLIHTRVSNPHILADIRQNPTPLLTMLHASG